LQSGKQVPLCFSGDEVESAYHPTKFLIRLQVPDIFAFLLGDAW
jgi:hypothetical protein